MMDRKLQALLYNTAVRINELSSDHAKWSGNGDEDTNRGKIEAWSHVMMEIISGIEKNENKS